MQSRLHTIDFNSMRGDATLQDEMLAHVLNILEAEAVQADSGVVNAIVRRYFPDMRQILKAVQFEVALVT